MIYGYARVSTDGPEPRRASQAVAHRGGNMVKYRKFKTAKQEIADVIRWAEKQGFFNIAEALRRALAEYFRRMIYGYARVLASLRTHHRRVASGRLGRRLSQ